jgi:hypothetical protein
VAGRTITDVSRAVTAALTPFVGRTMAEATVRGHLQKLGAVGELSPEQIETLLLRIEPGLNVFVGSERARQLTHEIRRRLSIAESDR